MSLASRTILCAGSFESPGSQLVGRGRVRKICVMSFRRPKSTTVDATSLPSRILVFRGRQVSQVAPGLHGNGEAFRIQEVAHPLGAADQHCALGIGRHQNQDPETLARRKRVLVSFR
jgi:hypothetical protein